MEVRSLEYRKTKDLLPFTDGLPLEFPDLTQWRRSFFI